MLAGLLLMPRLSELVRPLPQKKRSSNLPSPENFRDATQDVEVVQQEVEVEKKKLILYLFGSLLSSEFVLF